MAKKYTREFSPEFLEEIRSRLPISRVVGRIVELKKAGREYKGFSPFKNEKTPSFFVNDEKGFYHCFATGSHGDIFKFLMETEDITMQQAVERLAVEAGISVSGKQSIVADGHSFWVPGYVRLFISHRDTSKALAHDIAKWLEPYAITSFVAHDTIEPDKEWQSEIEKALSSMDAMLALVTEDFHGSIWTNQEIGFALGRHVPVFSVKVGSSSPRGFIQARQAVKLNIPNVDGGIRKIVQIVSSRLTEADKLKDALVRRFLEAPSFAEAQARFERLSVVDGYGKKHVSEIIRGFSLNNQLYDCFYLIKRGRLINFLHSCTGDFYEIKGARIMKRA